MSEVKAMDINETVDMLNSSDVTGVEIIPMEPNTVGTAKGMSSGSKMFVGGLVGFGVGIVSKMIFDVVVGIKRAKKALAEEEARKKAEEEANQGYKDEEEGTKIE